LKLESGSRYSISLGLYFRYRPNLKIPEKLAFYDYIGNQNIVAYFGYRPSTDKCWSGKTAYTAFAGKPRSGETADNAFVRQESTKNQRRLGASGATMGEGQGGVGGRATMAPGKETLWAKGPAR
jgi:hypothetical protein